MILITEIVVARPFPMLRLGELYHAEVGDVLTISSYYNGEADCIGSGYAKELLWSGFCHLPDDFHDAQETE